MKELHELIRDLRKDHNLKQKEVANYLNISQQIYSNYENGRRCIPLWVVTALAKFYKVSTDYLLGAGTSNYSDNTYPENITTHDIMCDIQKLRPQAGKGLGRYLYYLGSVEKYEASRKRSKG